MSSVLAEAIEIFGSRDGLEKCLRTVQYASRFAAGSGYNSKGLKALASSISSTRTITRYLDSLGMWAETLEYGLGREEPDTLVRIHSVASNILNSLFYPMEHIAFLMDLEVLDSSRWNKIFFWTDPSLRNDSFLPWFYSDAIYVACLLMDIPMGLRKLAAIVSERKKLSISRDRKALWKNTEAIKIRIITLCKDVADLICAIHWLDIDFWFSGKLSDRAVGFWGLLSSLIKLYLYLRSRKQKKD